MYWWTGSCNPPAAGTDAAPGWALPNGAKPNVPVLVVPKLSPDVLVPPSVVPSAGVVPKLGVVPKAPVPNVLPPPPPMPPPTPPNNPPPGLAAVAPEKREDPWVWPNPKDGVAVDGAPKVSVDVVLAPKDGTADAPENKPVPVPATQNPINEINEQLTTRTATRSY